MLNDIIDAQKLKAITTRAFEGKDGEFLMEYLEHLGNYNMPIFEKEEEGARRIRNSPTVTAVPGKNLWGNGFSRDGHADFEQSGRHSVTLLHCRH